MFAQRNASCKTNLFPFIGKINIILGFPKKSGHFFWGTPLGYMRAEKDTKKINDLVSKLRLLGADVRMENHQFIVKKNTKVDRSGVTST